MAFTPPWLFQVNSKAIVLRDANSPSQTENLSVTKVATFLSFAHCANRAQSVSMISIKSLPGAPTYLPLPSQSNHSYSCRPHPGYRTDLDHKHFGTRSFCIYNNISMLTHLEDLEFCLYYQQQCQDTPGISNPCILH